MMKGFLKQILAMFLMVGFFAASTAIVPLSVAAQTTDQEKEQAKKDEKKNKKEKTPKKTETKTQSTSTKLAVNENPAMIGKRNINGGGDKFWGWLGGSKEREMQLGRTLALEIDQQVKIIDDELVAEYVNRVGQNIVLHSDAKVPFTIKVIDSPEVNAFALPGGFFYVNSGLIMAADNESELAGVMAHEIAHVAARHAMENQGKAQAMNYGMLAGMIFGGAIIGTVLQNGGGILGALGMLKFSRGAEEEADRLGVQYLYASGYDPNGMATMFEKLASQNRKKPGTLQKLFSSHPQSIDRRDASVRLVAKFPEKDEYIISTSEFQRVKAYLMRQTNIRANVPGDVDEVESNRPTLKRRDPIDPNDPSSTTNPDNQNEPEEEKRPQLKRRDTPTPTPAPTPNQ